MNTTQAQFLAQIETTKTLKTMTQCKEYSWQCHTLKYKLGKWLLILQRGLYYASVPIYELNIFLVFFFCLVFLHFINIIAGLHAVCCNWSRGCCNNIVKLKKKKTELLNNLHSNVALRSLLTTHLVYVQHRL